MRIVTLFLVAAITAQAASVPSSDYVRAVTLNVLNGAGNIGGITFPSGAARNIVSYGADNTGAVAADTALASARAACVSGDYIYFPAGTYRINGGISITSGNISIIGEGMDLVTIDMRGGGFNFGQPSSFSNPVVDNTVTAGLTQGSQSITIGDTSSFLNGNMMCIFFSPVTDQTLIEAGEPPTFASTSVGAPTIRHMAMITGITGNTISFTPAIYHTPPAGQTAYVKVAQLPQSNNGIKGMTIDMANADSGLTFGVQFGDIYNGWIQDVKIENAPRYHLYVAGCVYFEMRECVIEDGQTFGSTNTSGLLMHNSTGALVEDNAFIRIFPGWEINFGVAGSVFAYNYGDGCGFNINHGPGNQYNIYEGNVLPQIMSDGYFGGSVRDAIFRNWLTGRTTRTDAASLTGMVELKRLTRKASVVGNYIGTTSSNYGASGNAYANWGTPNIGNPDSIGTAQPTLGSWWRDFNAATGQFYGPWNGTVTSGQGTASGVITLDLMSGTGGFEHHINGAYAAQTNLYWSGGSNTVVTAIRASISGSTIPVSLNADGGDDFLPTNGTEVTFRIDTNSMNEKDLDVSSSAYVKKNHHLYVGGVLSGVPSGEEDIGADTVPDSLFRSSKPDWFGNKPWPLFDTARATQPSYIDLPAAHRYIEGNTSYMSDGASATITTLNATTLNIP